MYFNKKVSNAMLSGAIETMRAENNEKTRGIVAEEILKANFLCPATLSLPPVKGPGGQLEMQDDCTLSWQMLADSTGRPLLMAFTSEEQMQKWKDRSSCGEVYGFSCSFPDYVDLMLHKQADGSLGPAEGFVIDPYGANLVVDREMAANLMVRLQMRP